MNDLYKYLKNVPAINPNVAVSIAAKDDGVDTSDATVAADKLLEGVIAYGKDGQVVGTIPSRGLSTITPGREMKTIPAGVYLSGVQYIVGDDTLVPENIKKGVQIFGVTGEYEVVTENYLDPKTDEDLAWLNEKLSDTVQWSFPRKAIIGENHLLSFNRAAFTDIEDFKNQFVIECLPSGVPTDLTYKFNVLYNAEDDSLNNIIWVRFVVPSGLIYLTHK